MAVLLRHPASRGLQRVIDAWQRQDPRLYQIAVLAALFGHGIIWLDFALPGVQAMAILVTVLLTQAVCSRLWQHPRAAIDAKPRHDFSALKSIVCTSS